jgi:hypothetical protein
MASKINPEVAARHVEKALQIASENVSTELSAEWDELAEVRSRQISSQLEPFVYRSSRWVVLFHVSLPPELKGYVASDINLAPDDHDFESVIRLNISLVTWSNPGSSVILITDQNFLANYKADHLNIVRIKINPAEIMFERVWCMAAMIRILSPNMTAFFLDSDAFLVNNASVFDALDFELALTYRLDRALMPINEGVIVAKVGERNLTKTFFDSYLATYVQLDSSGVLKEIYPSIRRWRGGQLSLNAVSEFYINLPEQDKAKPALIQLPCERFNLTLARESDIHSETVRQALVVHLKGNRKSWIRRLKNILQIDLAVPLCG